MNDNDNNNEPKQKTEINLGEYVIKAVKVFVEKYPQVSSNVARFFLSAIDLSKSDVNFQITCTHLIGGIESALASYVEGQDAHAELSHSIYELTVVALTMSDLGDEDIRNIDKYLKELLSKNSKFEDFLIKELGLKKTDYRYDALNHLAIVSLKMLNAGICKENFTIYGKIESAKLKQAIVKYFKELGGTVNFETKLMFKNPLDFIYDIGGEIGSAVVTELEDRVMVTLS